MPFFLLFAPIFGFAALAVFVAHAHKAPAARALPTTPPQPGTQQFELDHGLPEDVVHEVLAALVHVHDPTTLDALASKHAAKYPLTARELHAKAHAARASAATTSGTPDLGEAAVILQAAMKALTQESDPVELEGFAASIRSQYPTAAVLLLGRARELRAVAPPAEGAVPATTPAVASSAAGPAPVSVPVPGSDGRVSVASALPSPAAPVLATVPAHAAASGPATHETRT